MVLVSCKSIYKRRKLGYASDTWPRVIGSSLPSDGPGRLPPRVLEENALLYISFHFP